MSEKILVLTGGGTAGHVMPNLALAPNLRDQGWSLHYLGSLQGPERNLAESSGIPFYGISTGKLRRYFSCSAGLFHIEETETESGFFQRRIRGGSRGVRSIPATHSSGAA